jgi:hypothetical protein
MATWCSRSIASRETPSPPSWRAKCQNGFATLPPVPLQEQSALVLLLEAALVAWSVAIDERSGHEDLRDSGRQSVIPMSTGEYSCIAQACLARACLFVRP